VACSVMPKGSGSAAAESGAAPEKEAHRAKKPGGEKA